MDIANFINSVGFPIFSFCAAFYALKYSYDRSNNEIAKLTEAVNNNTIVLTRMVEHLSIGQEEHENED